MFLGRVFQESFLLIKVQTVDLCVSHSFVALSLSLAVCLCVCLQDYSALVMGFTKRRRQLQSCIFELLNIMLQIVSQKEV